jgi:Lar family restriction alleviation protein
MTKLKPCPFCGRPKTPAVDLEDERFPGVWFVRCIHMACACRGPWRLSEKGAIAAWNRRKP